MSRRRTIGLLVGAVIMVLVSAAVSSGTASSEAQATGTRTYDGATILHSQRMRAQGFKWDHEIRVAVPKGYYARDNAASNYPVLWVTDGSWAFDLAVALVNGVEQTHLPRMIVVGIGVPPEDEDRYYESRRIYDFFPSRPESRSPGRISELRRDGWAQYERHLADKGTPLSYGGAPGFLSFLVDQLRPTLAREYRMMYEQNTLFGYSAGGAFCEYVLLTRPEAFERYICGGGYTNEVMDAEEQYAKAHKDLSARVFFGIADDDVLATGFPLPLVLKNRAYPSLKTKIVVFSSQDHNGAIPLTMAQGLLFVWQDSPLPLAKLD